MRSSTLLQLAMGSAVFAAPMPQAGGMADMPGMAAPAAPAPATGLPAGLTLPPGFALPPGFDLGSIDLSQIGSLIGSLPPGTLDSLAAGGIPFGFDIGSIFGGGGPDNETPVIIAGYTAVKDKETLFDTAIAAIPTTGDASAAISDVLAKAKDVETALKESTAKVDTIGPVNLMASANLSGPGAEVTALFDKTADAIVAKKDVIVKAGKGAAVLAQAKAIKEAIDGFTKAINKKLPPISSSAAEAESTKALASAEKVITAFT